MTVLNLQVGASTDDAVESETNVFADTGAYINHTAHTSDASQRRWAGHRFTNVTIPAGSTISAADFQLNIWNASLDDIEGTWYCEDVDDGATFTSTTGPYDRRANVTTASTAHSATGLGTGWVSMADLVDEVAEVIARGGWASGQALLVFFGPGNTTTRSCFAISWDNDTSNAAKLDITYTEPATPSGHTPRRYPRGALRGVERGAL